MAKKDEDLMEQVRNTKYDEKSYFEMCKKQVLNVINNTYFKPNDSLLFNNLFKYFNLRFSQETQDLILTGKYRVPPELLDEKAKNVIQELLKQEYFLYNDYENNICYALCNDYENSICYAPIKIRTRWLIDENNFEKTLCNFLKAARLFCDCYKQFDEIVKQVARYLTDYYEIKVDNKAEFGIRVIPKYDTEIIQAVEDEPSLQTVMKYYYQNDIKKALGELRKITEFSNKKNEEFKKFIQSQSTELQEMCQQVYKFITKYENHNGEFADATETEARVWFDLGLSIYRLFTIYGD